MYLCATHAVSVWFVSTWNVVQRQPSVQILLATICRFEMIIIIIIIFQGAFSVSKSLAWLTNFEWLQSSIIACYDSPQGWVNHVRNSQLTLLFAITINAIAIESEHNNLLLRTINCERHWKQASDKNRFLMRLLTVREHNLPISSCPSDRNCQYKSLHKQLSTFNQYGLVDVVEKCYKSNC